VSTLTGVTAGPTFFEHGFAQGLPAHPWAKLATVEGEVRVIVLRSRHYLGDENVLENEGVEECTHVELSLDEEDSLPDSVTRYYLCADVVAQLGLPHTPILRAVRAEERAELLEAAES
jgi:hypothetical protein